MIIIWPLSCTDCNCRLQGKIPSPYNTTSSSTSHGGNCAAAVASGGATQEQHGTGRYASDEPETTATPSSPHNDSPTLSVPPTHHSVPPTHHSGDTSVGDFGSEHEHSSESRPPHFIIIDEDPTQPAELIEPDEEDAYIAFAQDGLGYELDQDYGGDDDDAGTYPAGGDAPSEADLSEERRKQSRTNPLPPWLMDSFRARVEESRERGPDKLPSLYRSGTFWFPKRSPYFLLRTGQPSPQLLFEAQFFLWDPLALHDIPCPHCQSSLIRGGHIRWPRRVVDLDRAFWMIGYRYRCSACFNPRTGRRGTSSFCSWDLRIVNSLPADLRTEFPARLSKRSGISLPLFNMMRSCFQNGMGAKQFSDALRVQHLRHYDVLHLQYLHFIHDRQQVAAWPASKSFSPFLSFTDHSSDGYFGYVPGAQWLRDMFDNFAEEHNKYIEQHTAMLTGEVCAVDHSHKVSDRSTDHTA